MRTFILATLFASLAAACQPSPDECMKGNDEACYKLCETGKEEFQSLCFMPRARAALACAEKDTACETACKEWPLPKTGDDALYDEDRRNTYMGNIGDTAKVAAIDAKCSAVLGKTPAAAPGEAAQPAAVEPAPAAPAGGAAPATP